MAETNELNLSSVGQALREERERQGLSLDDVAAISKISPHTLATLEQGEVSSMPHHVYVKGFVKTYAAILKADSRKLGQMVDEAFTKAGMEIPEPSPLVTQPYISPPAKAKGPGGKIVAFVLVAAIIGGGIWAAMKYLPLSQSEENADPVQAANSPTGSEHDTTLLFPGAQESSTRNSEMDSGQENTPPDSGPADEHLAAASTAANATDSDDDHLDPLAENEEDDPFAQVEQAEAGDSENVLEIFAVEDCWLRTRINGQNATERVLYSGQRMDLPFNGALEIRLGNSLGVRMRFNGDPVTVNATGGNVRTLVFPPVE
ncbi:MAG: helix-turn-helix domain-containing protein [Desulfovibrio sp.]|nr:MAG: helix-turn-helix domain-containing protein [Desulfovibrio sp.]